MTEFLDKIIEQTACRVATLKATHPEPCFKQALAGERLAFIGEIKRRSPSKGPLAPDLNLETLLDAYIEGGVAAVSVLTEPTYFHGSMHDLEQAAHHLNKTSIPLLRKDFILDKLQLLEAFKAGAHAVLLIVCVLQEKTVDFITYAKQLGLEAVVEVHTRDELELALSMQADMILINNRNLSTFKEDINTCLSLAPHLPKHVTSIAASAIKTPEAIQAIHQAGFNAVLLGETLVTADNPIEHLNHLRALL